MNIKRPLGDLGEALDLVGACNHSGRIVWRDQDDGSAPGIDLRFQMSQIDPPAGSFIKPVIRDFDASKARDIVEQGIGRNWAQNVIAWIA